LFIPADCSPVEKEIRKFLAGRQKTGAYNERLQQKKGCLNQDSLVSGLFRYFVIQH